MPIWEACTTRIEWHDGTPPHEDDDTDVHIEDGRIVVCYWDDQGPVVFEGTEEAPGHFELTARSRPRKATLALVAEGRRLEGSFEERGAPCGTLRIDLTAT